jgi:hypothetical protein
LAISLTWIYLATIAPGLTWANSGSDGGDLITAAATGGIAHPSGYPVYLLLARGFQLLPVGSLAFRTNLMSAFFAVATSLLVYLLVFRRACEGMQKYQAYIASLSAGFAVGLSPLVWSQAVITEVYTLHAFFTVLILYLAVQPATPQLSRQVRLDCMRGIIYGLALGNHLTAIVMIPGAIVVSCVSRYSSPQKLTGLLRNIKVDWKSAGRQFTWMLVGFSVYMILPLRAMTHPVINWGNPVNLQNIWWLVSGDVYRSYYLPGSLIQIWPRIQAGANLLLQQFGFLGILLGFTGLIVLFRLSRLYVLTIWSGLVFTVIAIGYQSHDSFVYFIPAIISFSIWIGISVGHIVQFLTKWHALWIWLFTTALLINLSLGVVTNWNGVDASRDDRAENFGRQMFASLPENAIVFVEGDQAVFASWYFHFALKQRPDISVVATDLLHWAWYLDSMKTAYPLMNFSTPFPWPSTIIVENPTRPACQVKYVDHMDIACEKK